MAKIDKKKLALIHIVKKELGLDDSKYRKILKEAAGVASAKDLDRAGFRKLMNHFVRSRHWKSKPDGLTIRQKIYIKMLVEDLGWEKDHLNNFIHKYYHKNNFDQLSKKEAIKLIESLKSIKERQDYF
ncbi:MAG: regulatory protein GemA [Candidatus Omnitrophica bacterium]|nr:regulatory protein GemA [Candidatus Omnitrophota bacterium]MCF7895546.1 regulatory protein GemA [Candidatus Omnitrophota bacterium]MCF7897219.1 regulatory protein GemA [Candidatus Omnitrophota bacterium]MCF7909817.1 regulatory protein GemA [Candidatus Omnitrophota bacterium]